MGAAVVVLERELIRSSQCQGDRDAAPGRVPPRVRRLPPAKRLGPQRRRGRLIRFVFAHLRSLLLPHHAPRIQDSRLLCISTSLTPIIATIRYPPDSSFLIPLLLRNTSRPPLVYPDHLPPPCAAHNPIPSHAIPSSLQQRAAVFGAEEGAKAFGVIAREQFTAHSDPGSSGF